MRYGRAADSVQLIAVSKSQPADAVRAVAALGQTHFGENYLQEALPKLAALADLPLTWHFIGQLQSNKTRAVAEHFHWVHTLDRERIAVRLNEQRSVHAPPHGAVRVFTQIKAVARVDGLQQQPDLDRLHVGLGCHHALGPLGGLAPFRRACSSASRRSGSMGLGR